MLHFMGCGLLIHLDWKRNVTPCQNLTQSKAFELVRKSQIQAVVCCELCNLNLAYEQSRTPKLVGNAYATLTEGYLVGEEK